MKTKKIEVEEIRENIISLQICTNMSPKEVKKKKIREAIENRLSGTGIRSQWKIDLSIAPVQCGERSGYWHYICTC